MSNLRDLLGIVSEDTLKASAAPDDTTKIARLPSEGYCVQYISAYCGAKRQNKAPRDHVIAVEISRMVEISTEM